MSKSRKPRKAYRPRQIAINTLEIALYRAAKPAKVDRDDVLNVLHQAVTALREGVATELQWSIVAGGVNVARAIERQGIVRGLTEHIDCSDRALQSIYDRAMASGSWRPTALYYYELDAVKTFAELHAFQVNQLARSELLQAIDQATNETITQGHQATVVRDLEKMVA